MNTNENVRIHVTGNPADIRLFLNAIQEEAPPASVIEDVIMNETGHEAYKEFTILHSHDVSDDITEISPDIAVCPECLEDICLQGNRLNYAFVNCTNCGPRFTIIRDLPYDRAKTTMQEFPMCSDCRKEYENTGDRRFHAQPVACERCGPHYELFVRGIKISEAMNAIIRHVAQRIETGGILLIKGLGGMHLACDAFNESVVTRMRDLKKRDGKPFAVMFRDVESIKRYAIVSSQEEKSLLSWRRPIVLLVKKNHGKPLVANNVSSGLNLLGVMLPYLPFHALLFQKLQTSAIVLTSGNFSNEPILIDNGEAMFRFSDFLDAVVLHNREIHNRTDDSVVRIMDEKERVFRRSRGYVPAPVRTLLNTDGILAFGAELTNCFCIGKGRKAFLSQHIGDLQGLETVQFYEQTITRFLQLFRVKPSLLVVDMHPEYLSTKTARNFSGLPVVPVQHHHAHIAACMAEHHLDDKVIGVAMDGTGYGDDGHIWGSEFLVCDLTDYRRITHFEYLPLPGGDLAAEEPWRMGVSCLYKVFGKELVNLKLPFVNNIEVEKLGVIIRMIDRKVNCPLTSGAGRLFDAVAALLDLCMVASFQAEGPMRLESLADKNYLESYPFEVSQTIRLDGIIRGVVEDLTKGADNAIIASKFHNTIISIIFETVKDIREKEGLNTVVLSGGVFQNKYLLEGTITLLKANKFDVYTHETVPTNDGGVSLGQLAIASKRRSLSCV